MSRIKNKLVDHVTREDAERLQAQADAIRDDERESAAFKEWQASKVTPKFIIWSHEHCGWWKPNRNGYTSDSMQAGRYALDEALEIVSGANIRLGREHDAPEETMCPAPEGEPD